MCDQDSANRPRRLVRALEDNIDIIRNLLGGEGNSDAQFRRFEARGRHLCIAYMDGLTDAEMLAEYALRACASMDAADGARPLDARAFILYALEIPQCEIEVDAESIVKAIAGGMSALIIDGCREAVLMDTRSFPARQVGQPSGESVIIGAQEGFVENLRVNMTLLRRYVPSPRLVTQMLNVGDAVSTKVCVAHLAGAACQQDLERLLGRLRAIRRPAVLGIGELQQLLEDSPASLLPQFLMTERPDRAASCILEGQIVVLAENSPYALIAPATLFHLLHTSDDTFARWQYGTFLRLVRIAGMLISLLLPAMYIALLSFHMHLLPMSLLSAIAETRARVPFPIVAEVLMMEFSFWLINEAGTRIPRQIGSGLGIVGALILGQAAVSASIISPMLIIIVALTGLGNYAAPNYEVSLGLILCRIFLAISAALLGLFGVAIASTALFVSLCGMTSLGHPFLRPVAPGIAHNPDILLRLPIWMQKRVAFSREKKEA